jgi:Protein of unknown function (DUF3105)
MSKGNTKGRPGSAKGKPAGARQGGQKPSGGQQGVTQQAGEQTAGAQTAASQPASPRPATSRPASKGGPRRRRRGINWVWVIAAVGGAALLGALIFNIAREVQVIAGVQNYGPFPANVHVDGDVTYAQTPPTGGEHRATWQNCGIYNDPLIDELAVHSMEHGAVWITYRPDLPADQVEQLKGLVRGKSYTLLSPFPDLPSPVVASAWGVQLTADSADDGRLGQFVSKYRQGAQTPEPGATCVGGSGSPDE